MKFNKDNQRKNCLFLPNIYLVVKNNVNVMKFNKEIRPIGLNFFVNEKCKINSAFKKYCFFSSDRMRPVLESVQQSKGWDTDLITSASLPAGTWVGQAAMMNLVLARPQELKTSTIPFRLWDLSLTFCLKRLNWCQITTLQPTFWWPH